MEKKKFIAIVFNLDNEIFVIYITFLASLNLNIHPFFVIQKALLIKDKVFIAVLLKYIDFANIFSSNFVVNLLEYIVIDNYSMNLVKG